MNFRSSSIYMCWLEETFDNLICRAIIVDAWIDHTAYVIATYGTPSVVGVGDGLGRGNKLISASITR